MGKGGREKIVDWLAKPLTKGDVRESGWEFSFEGPVKFGIKCEMG
jgi:hypothetical protein